MNVTATIDARSLRLPAEPLIRPYVESDVNACRSLWSVLTEHHREIYCDEEIGGDDPGPSFDKYKSDSNLQGLWVASISEKVVGLAGLVVEGDEAAVEPIVVLPKYRTCGVGTMLLNLVVEQAKAHGVRFLNVRPVARNVQAIEFFVGAGFNLVGHIELFQDLSPESPREWMPGLRIHGKSLYY